MSASILQQERTHSLMLCITTFSVVFWGVLSSWCLTNFHTLYRRFFKIISIFETYNFHYSANNHSYFKSFLSNIFSHKKESLQFYFIRNWKTLTMVRLMIHRTSYGQSNFSILYHKDITLCPSCLIYIKAQHEMVLQVTALNAKSTWS